MPILPLVLALEPLLPTRSASGQRKEFRTGYQLRFPGGPVIRQDDPLLAVFGAEFVWLAQGAEHEEPIQSGGFDPGARSRPVCESLDDDGDPVVAIWDAEGLHCGGLLPYPVAARAAAALEHGLDIELISVQESRAALDDRRVALGVLMCSPSMVCVQQPEASRAIRPARRGRRRVILLADGSGQLRWWDPTAETGPAEITQLPVSSHLQAELDRLGTESAKLARRAEETHGGFGRMELDWDRSSLTGKAVSLWQRVRAELGRDYAVGFLGPGMERPVWSPTELYDKDKEDGLPF